MKFALAAGLVCVFLASNCPECRAQDKGAWRAASSAAKNTTGDIALTDEKLYINFVPFTIAPIRALKADEGEAVFSAMSGVNGLGNLYRVSIPGDRKFLHKNSLCGSDETQWMVTFAAGRELAVAFFSGAQMPVLSPEALRSSDTLCGTFTYAH